MRRLHRTAQIRARKNGKEIERELIVDESIIKMANERGLSITGDGEAIMAAIAAYDEART